ncbi:MAG: hypothetical protein ABII00_12895 [Elusimicrobiota bacterium]
MTDERPGEGVQDGDIQETLIDLDNILQTLTGPVEGAGIVEGGVPPAEAEAAPSAVEAGPRAAHPQEQVPPPAAEKPVEIPKAEVSPPAEEKPVEVPRAELAPPAEPEPVEGARPSEQPKPEEQTAPGIELAPRAGVIPVVKKKQEEKKPPVKKRGLSDTGSFEITVDGVPVQPERKKEPTPPEPAPAPHPEIELAPRAGMLKPVEKETAEKKPSEKKGLPETVQKEASPEGAQAKAPEPAAAAPEPAAVAPAAPAKKGPRGVSTDPEPIPDKTPAEQIRRIAFLYDPGHETVYVKFSQFLSEVAAKVSKKPLYLHKAVVAGLTRAMDTQELLGHFKKTGAVGVFLLVEGVNKAQILDIEKTCEDEDIFFAQIAPEEVDKRTRAIDLVVDLMLMKAG